VRFFPSLRLARDDERLEFVSSFIDDESDEVDENFLLRDPGTLVYLTGEKICLQEKSLFNYDDEKPIGSNRNLN